MKRSHFVGHYRQVARSAVQRLKSRLKRHKARFRGLSPQSAEADFVLFQPRLRSLGDRMDYPRLTHARYWVDLHHQPGLWLMALLTFGFAIAEAAAQTLDAPELTYALTSGTADGGGSDTQIWVQGAAAPRLGVGSSGLALQQAFIVPPQASWASLGAARWIGPTPAGVARPGGYEYFTLFALPPGYRSVMLDVLWRADDASELAVNGTRLPVVGGHFSPSRPAAEFHGEIGHLLTVGMNRLQFFVANAGAANNPTGLLFTARLTLSRTLPEPTLRVTIAGLAAGAFDPERTKVWHFHRDNPILRPEGELEMQAGEGNIYAPDVHRDGDLWRMYYGGQGRDGHDRIFAAASTDGIFWRRLGDGKPLIDVDREGRSANHVNDPSAVVVNGRTEIFYTRAPEGERDLIDRFVDGRVDFSILPLGPPGAWDSFKLGRPSVLYENGVYKMWYDGVASRAADPQQPDLDAGRHVGFATSRDGVNWVKHPGNPVLRHGGAVDVKRVGERYLLVQESPGGTRWALGASETSFADQGYLLRSSGDRYDRFGHVTPNLYVEGDRLVAVYFGAAQGTEGVPAAAWNRNRIAVAFLQKEVVARTPAGERVLADVRALDADRVEVRLPEAYQDRPVVFDILAEDGRTLLLHSQSLNLRPDLYLRFNGSRLDPL